MAGADLAGAVLAVADLAVVVVDAGRPRARLVGELASIFAVASAMAALRGLWRTVLDDLEPAEVAVGFALG